MALFLRSVSRRPLLSTTTLSSSTTTTTTTTLRNVHRRLQSTRKTTDPIPVAGTVAPLPFWQRLGPLTRTAQAYARAQRTRPYVTQLATAVGIYLLADFSAQYMGGEEYDSASTVRSVVIGCAVAIPNHHWFMFLAHNFNYTSRILSLGTKVLVNQMVFTPSFNVFYFGAQALLSGETVEAAIERVWIAVPSSTLNAMKVWPAVTAFSFTFVPIEYRPIFAGFVAVGWQTYLSYLNRQAEEMAALQHAGDVVDEKKRFAFEGRGDEAREAA